MGCALEPLLWKSAPLPKRNVERAKQLKEAGVPNPSFTLMTPTTSDAQRIAQIVQAMRQEAGRHQDPVHRIRHLANLADKGQFEAYVLAWSGRADPDGNLHTMLACKGPTNYAGYCKDDVEKLITESRPRSTRAAPLPTTRSRSRCRRTARSSTLPSPLALGAHREAVRPAHRSGRHGAGARLEDELMLKFVLQRLATVIPTLFFVSILIFGLQQLLPGTRRSHSPARSAIRNDPLPAREVSSRRALWSILVLGFRVVRGDLGDSVRIQKPVTELIVEKLPVTIQLATMAMDHGRHRHHRGRDLGSEERHVVGLRRERVRALGPSTPNFWLGILLILRGAVGWLPASGT